MSGPPGREIAPPDTARISLYPALLRRRFRLLLAGTIAGTALGVFFVLTAPTTYTSTVTVLAPPVILNTGLVSATLNEDGKVRQPREVTMDTEAQLVHSTEVLSKLATIPGFGSSPQSLRDRVNLTVPANTRVISLAVRGNNAIRARDGAETVADAYLNLRQQLIDGFQQRDREALQRRVELFQQQLNALQTKEPAAGTDAVRIRSAAISKQIREVEKQIDSLEGRAFKSGVILRGADIPASPDDRALEIHLSQWIGLGVLAGLLAGLTRERVPQAVRSAAGLRLRTDVPIIGEIASDPQSRNAASLRLRLLLTQEHAASIIMMGMPPSAAISLARDLAAMSSRGHTRTALLKVVDGLPGSPADDLPYSIVETSAENGDRGLIRSLVKVRRQADLVIVAGESLTGQDAIALAAGCDLSVVVVERGTIVDRDVREGMNQLEQAGVSPLGILLVDAERETTR